MNTYKQTVKFERHFEIQARDAASANKKLDELVRDAEFGGDVQEEGHYEFEDEPVECPKCSGIGFLEDQDGEPTCDNCKGEGSIPFVATDK